MHSNDFTKSSIAAAVLITVFIIFWEYYWRSRGFTISYNNDKVLWATQRKNVYQSINNATVFVGSSRLRLNIDIPTWKMVTGEDPVQLALGGTPPRLILLDLAKDENFTGKIIADVMEPLFFSTNPSANEKSAREALEYFYNETPAQKSNAALNYFLESKFVFLEEGVFGLNNLLGEIKLPTRQGMVYRPPFPKEFLQSSFERQGYLTPMILSDTTILNRKIQASISSSSFFSPGIKGNMLDSLFNELKMAIDKIKARGGMVVFVRPPSTKLYKQNENNLFPREQYWDKLLAFTQVPGIHYSDYPVTAALDCPDWTHLSPDGARIYTRELIKILERDMNWHFHRSKIGFRWEEHIKAEKIDTFRTQMNR